MIEIIVLAGFIAYIICPVKELVALFVILISAMILAAKLFGKLEVE